MNAKSTIKTILRAAMTLTELHKKNRPFCVLLLLVMMLTATTAWAQVPGNEGDWDYTYYSETNSVTIFSYHGTDASVTTPTMLGGHAVTAISNHCFKYYGPQTYMTSVTISEGITTIGSYAFNYCYHLASVNLPNSLASIGERAFKQCPALTSITIPSSVTEIGPYAFEKSGLTDLYYTGTKAQWNNVTKDRIFYYVNPTPTVHWRCTATFDMQGHGTAPDAQTMWNGGVVTQPATAPTAQGYDFGGWYRDAACTEAFDFTAALDDNVTVYAKWTALENTIQFDLGGRGTAISNQTVTSGNTVPEPLVQFDGTDGIEGWYTDEGRTVAFDFMTAVDHSFTLYAKWAAAGTATINVTNGEGGTATLTNAKGQTFNDGLVMPGTYTLTVTPDDGYSFSGSYTLSERSGSLYPAINISGNATKTYALDLTTNDVAISVTFTNQPTVSISVTNDGRATATGYSYTLKDGQTPPVTYTDNMTLQHVVDPNAQSSNPAYDLVLTINKGEYGCTGTIVNNGVTTNITDNKTTYAFTPHGSIAITLYFFDKSAPVVTTYAITTDGNCEVYYTEGWDEVIVTEAEEGKELAIRIKEDAQPATGKYFTGEFKLNGTSLGKNGAVFVDEFTMPAAAVTVSAVQADQMTLTYDFTTAGAQEMPSAAELLFNGDGRVNYAYVEEGGYTAYDFDKSGTPDMKLYFDNDREQYYVQRLTGADAKGTFTFTYTGRMDQYGSITFFFPTVTTAGGTTITTTIGGGYAVSVDDVGNTGGVIDLTDGTEVGLTYSRTLSAPSGSGDKTIDGQAAQLYTTCLPYAPTTGTGIKYYTLSGASGSTLLFDEDNSPAAETPYLVAVFNGSYDEGTTGTDVTLKKVVSASSSADGYTMRGTLMGLTNSEAAGKYILQTGGVWKKVASGNESVYVPPFRAYIEGTASAARLLGSTLDGETVGIDSIRTTDSDGTERWYDLNGRRIAKPNRKGIYIRNGKVTTTDLTD